MFRKMKYSISVNKEAEVTSCDISLGDWQRGTPSRQWGTDENVEVGRFQTRGCAIKIKARIRSGAKPSRKPGSLPNPGSCIRG